MATITKTPSGTWKAVIRRVGWPTTSKTFRTRRDAEDWSRRTEDEMVRGVFIQRSQSERLTVEEALARYEREVVPNKKESTRAREGARVRELNSFFAKHSLASITPDLVAKFRDSRLAQGKANNTVRLELALLSHLFTTAIREWQIGLTFNPVMNIRKPAAGAGRNRRISKEEEALLLKAVDAHSNPMLGWIVRIAIETGMRKSEIITLRRSQIDLVRRVARLTDTKNGSERTVPLSFEATRVFKLALTNPILPIETDLIFYGEPGYQDKKRRPFSFAKIWIDIKKKNGMSDLHFHDLRHEAVSRLVERGFGDMEIAAISGHKSMQMIKRYTHLRAEDLVKKLDLVG